MYYSHRLYSAQQSRELDRIAIEGRGDNEPIPSFVLMQRAASAVFEFSQLKFSQAHSILVLCGSGNNAGDGYLFACLAREHGLNVTVYSLVDPVVLKNDAEQAYVDWLQAGGELSDELVDDLHGADLIVDAIFGTGLQRDVSGEWLEVIEQVNAIDTPVISIDIPSGLHADTGAVMGAAIKADYTVCLIGLKKGLFTGQARDYCGEIIFNDCQIPHSAYALLNEDAQLLSGDEISQVLTPRAPCTHKGQTGHLLIAGGNYGMCGAVILAAQAALRSGVGRVSVVTRAEHVAAIVARQPEIMAYGIEDEIPEELLERVDVIAVGPGLGRDDWGNQLLKQVLYQDHFKVLDADALYHLPEHAVDLSGAIITPHPGEAAHLLSSTATEIEANRYAAIERLYQEYGAMVVLKGAGSLIYDGKQPVGVCPFGNPGMASGGMGDILTGLIASFIAQGVPYDVACRVAVCLHSQAADDVAAVTARGYLASDLLAFIQQRINIQ